ncbi:MAG: hypothetical protein M1826_006540 [Phylliscum demangeonii]|nr:MAG: hypothetical protein M1826_006540 [Phylliscum demangeonii]
MMLSRSWKMEHMRSDVARPEQTHQEKQTREAAPFEEMERSLPTLSCRFPSRILDNCTSYLGSRNPFAHNFNPATDEIWLFDNTAFRSSRAPGRWTAEYVAAFFRRGTGEDLARVVADLAQKLDISHGSEEEAVIRERLEPFVDAVLPARTVEISVASEQRGTASERGTALRLGPGGRSGISSDELKIPARPVAFEDGQAITSHAQLSPAATMTTSFAEPTGWAVISDVDDTIKLTMTSAPLGILRTTFIDKPQPIAGMPKLYGYIDSALSHPAWFYLSASPYNLYRFLHAFRRDYYPQGTIILRDASWKTLGGFLTSLTLGTQDYKVSRMQKIHRWLPDRRFLCIGDSTQTDPESYGEMYRRHPGWIRQIFIRKVLDVAEINCTDKNKDDRFEKAFRGVPRSVWRTFEDPVELYAAVEALVGAVEGEV